MALVSDFVVASGSRFLSNAQSLSLDFTTSGRNASTQTFLQLSGLGGFRQGQEALGVRIDLNGNRLTTVMFRRWQSHFVIVPDVVVVDFASSLLRSNFLFWPQLNTLLIRPIYEDSSDYAWIGPVIVNFHQSA
jgi:hypothetical protein